MLYHISLNQLINFIIISFLLNSFIEFVCFSNINSENPAPFFAVDLRADIVSLDPGQSQLFCGLITSYAGVVLLREIDSRHELLQQLCD